jgi:heme A synthase
VPHGARVEDLGGEGVAHPVGRLPAALPAAAAVLVLAIASVLWARTRQDRGSTAHGRTTLFLAVFVAQGLIGLTQIATGLAETVIVAHLLGSAFVWAGAVRVFLDTHTRTAPHRHAHGSRFRSRPAALS